MSILRTAIACVITAMLVAFAWTATPDSAHAGLFTKIFREAADSAGDAGKLSGKLADLDVPRDVARLVDNLPKHARNRALISQATPEGHVRLTNPAGETVTASTPEEISAALKWLLPDASEAARNNVDFYFPTSALSDGRPALNILPRSARTHIIHKEKSYAVLGSPPFETKALRVRLRANVVVRAHNADVLKEAIWQVDQPLKPSQVRVVSLDPTTSTRLQPVRPDAAASKPAVEAANPYDLAKSMSGLSRQTVVLSGKIDGKVLYYTPESGNTQSVLLADLRNSAARADANLIILDTDSPRQPGVRNLLWQRAEVDGLDEALKSATIGDFWSAIITGRAPLELEIAPSGKTYVSVSAKPRPGLARQLPDDDDSLLSTTGRILTEVVSNVSGNVVTNGIDAAMRSRSHQQELDMRIIPFLPAMPQIFYILALVVGLAGLRTIKSWWRKLWPLRERASFASTLGWLANRVLRGFPFLFVFMPLVAFVATPYQMISGPLFLVWRIVSAPFRWIWSRSRAA